MIQIQQTLAYAKWFTGLRDRVARDNSTQDEDIRNDKALARDLKE